MLESEGLGLGTILLGLLSGSMFICNMGMISPLSASDVF